MTRKERAKGLESNAPGAENRSIAAGRWSHLRQFVLSRVRGKKMPYREGRESNEIDTLPMRRASRMADYGFLQKQRNGENTKDVGSASRSLRSFKKTRTFAGVFGRGKGNSSEDEVGGELEDAVTTGSLPFNQQTSSGEGTTSSTSKSVRLHRLRESNANRTIVFKGDLPPCSPLSTKRLTSDETERNGSRQSNETGAESKRLKQLASKGGTSGAKDGRNDNPLSEAQISSASTSESKTMNLKKTLLNIRLGAIVCDDRRIASHLQSSPLGSPRRMHRRTSSLPKYIGLSVVRSTSVPAESRDGAKQAVSDDYESPWGVKDICETDGEGENRHSTKTFRVTEFVNGLKGRKPAHHSSKSLSLTDDESDEANNMAQTVDMLKDEFVDYSIKHILKIKNSRHKGNRNKTRRGRQIDF